MHTMNVIHAPSQMVRNVDERKNLIMGVYVAIVTNLQLQQPGMLPYTHSYLYIVLYLHII